MSLGFTWQGKLRLFIIFAVTFVWPLIITAIIGAGLWWYDVKWWWLIPLIGLVLAAIWFAWINKDQWGTRPWERH